MNIRKHLTRYAMALMGLIMLAACSSDDNWQAGPMTKEGCQQVHFAGNNDELAILDDQNPDDRTVNLTVVRNTTAGELSVPMTVEKCSEGLTILQSEVKFEDGQNEASITIEVTGQAVKGTRYDYSLLLTGDEIDPYAATDGGSRMEGIISFPSEKTVKMWVVGMENTLGYWNETILDLGGGRYRFENLMESGMQLDLATATDGILTLSSPVWAEEEGNMSYNYYTTNDCYFWCNQYDYDLGDYVYWPFYPHGKDAYVWIEQLDMYTDPDINNWYSYYWEGTYENESFFNISIPNLKLNGKANLWWQNIRFRFLADGEQPEEYLPDAPDTPDVPEPGILHKPGTYTVEMWFEGAEGIIGNSWNETMTVNEDGTYNFADLMNSGMDLSIALDGNYRMTLTSSWLSEEDGNVIPNYWYTTDCYYYCNRWNDAAGEYVYWPFYPYGTSASTYVEYITMYTDSNTSNWYSYYYEDPDNAADSYFSIELGYLKLSNESNYREWAELRFRITE